MRKKWACGCFVAVAVVAVGIVGVLAVQYGAYRRFVASVRPTVAFAPETHPAAPDYGDASSWAVTPEALEKAAFIPEGVATMDPREPLADVFFVHPTMYFATTSWNAPMEHVRANEGVDELVVPAQASVWNGCCRVFAPRYRQATVYVFLEPGEEGRGALDLAYSDVERAFVYYLERWNGGRPFFLASHSQGTAHEMRLLEERIVGQPAQELLVAAYLIGFRLPEEKLGTSLAGVPACAAPGDTGCVVAWDTYGEGSYPGLVDRGEVWDDGAWRARTGKPPLCVNPLSWRRDTEPAAASANAGAVHIVMENAPSDSMALFRGAEPLGLTTTGLSAPLVGEVGARCGDDGFLYISRPTSAAFQRAVLPGRNYHNHDYGLFYMNLRRNAAQRAAAFVAAHDSP